MAVRRTKKSPVKKNTRKNVTVTSISMEYKQWLIAILFLFLAVLAIITDTRSVFWNKLYWILNQAFWEYYKFIFSPVLILLSAFILWKEKINFNLLKSLWLIVFYIWLTSFFGFIFKDYSAIFDFSKYWNLYFWEWATIFIIIISFVLSLVILFRFSPVHFTKNIVSTTANFINSKRWNLENEYEHEDELEKKSSKSVLEVKRFWKRESNIDRKKDEISKMLEELKLEKENIKNSKKNIEDEKQLQLEDAPKKIQIEKKVPPKIKSFMDKKEGKITEEENTGIIHKKFDKWEYPQLDLLDDKWGRIKYNEAEIKQKELEIQEKLLQFNVDVNMKGFNVGPTVIQYRLQPSSWVPLKKIVNLKNDLTLALHAKNIRIQAPIPWQWVVGIEVPNPDRQIVGLKELLKSKEFNNPKLKIPLAFGKNVNGEMVVGDLTKMPHMLVAGQTASGKSVWVNTFLLSMLYKFTPSELKLILIDPKIVELSVYNWIPHLLTPVITKPEKALNSLKWCVAEMLRRYDLERQVGARNLEEYNDKVNKDKKLPYIVIVLDELADLMMSWDKKEVEWNITRIAQMARAVWMHLIIATQRPSVNIITWVIKANVPSRVAFTVSSQIDSQTILWRKWAEDLLGYWDMLYFPTWVLEPERVQWVFVETHEVEAVINKLKLTIDPGLLNNMQDDSIVNWRSKTEGSILENYSWNQEEDPEIIERAMQVVKEAKKGSTSLIQRKLSLWYWRAAKILDILEELWVVWPSNGSKPREVFID
jgi:S-DNA-T family DNA segregation ATPase FtsK/SpoIIIE